MAKCEMIVAPLQAAATTASQPPALINIFPGGGRAPPRLISLPLPAHGAALGAWWGWLQLQQGARSRARGAAVRQEWAGPAWMVAIGD